MPQVINTKTNLPVEVADAELLQLLRDGAVAFAKPKLNLVAPDGQVVGIESTSPQLLQALEDGYRLETPTEYHDNKLKQQYGDSPILAGTLGALRGATLGLSDVVLTKGLGKDPEAIKALKELNPTASTVGDVGGTIASLLLTGGAGGVAKGGAATIKAGAKAALSPARLAAEAGEFAAKKTAEKIIAKNIITKGGVSELMAKGAAMGVVESTLFSTGQVVSEAALGDLDLASESVAGRILGDALTGAFIGGALPGIGAGAKWGIGKSKEKIRAGLVKYEVPQKVKEAAKDKALDALDPTKSTRNALLQRGVEEEAKEKLLMPGIHPDGKPIIAAGKNIHGNAKRLEEAVEHQGKTLNKLYASLQELHDTVDAKDFFVALKKFVKQVHLSMPAEKALDTKTKMMVGEINKLINKYRREPKTLQIMDLKRIRELAQESAFNEGRAKKEAKAKAFQGLYKYINGYENDLIKRLAPNAVYEDLMRAKNNYADLALLNIETQKRVRSIDANAAVGLLDSLAGVTVASATGGNILLGLAAAKASKEARARLPSATARALDKAASLMAVEEVTGTQKALMGDKVKKTITEIFADTTKQPLTRQVLIKSNLTTEKNIDNITEMYSSDSIERIKNLTLNELSEDAPIVASRSAMAVEKALRYLANKRPKPIMVDQYTSATPKVKYNRQDVISFNRMVNGLNDPISALEQMAKYGIHKETLDAIREVYPYMYNTFINQLLAEFQLKKSSVPIAKRSILKSLIGPQQRIFTLPQQQEQQQTSLRKSGLKDLTKDLSMKDPASVGIANPGEQK